MSKETGDIRALVLHAIGLIADREKLLSYQRDAPIANVPAELFCMWFDDAYHPESQQFCAEFTEEERSRLAEFNMVFAAFSDGVGELLPPLALLIALPGWQNVADHAARTCALLDAHFPDQG